MSLELLPVINGYKQDACIILQWYSSSLHTALKTWKYAMQEAQLAYAVSWFQPSR